MARGIVRANERVAIFHAALRVGQDQPVADLYLSPEELRGYFNPANEIQQAKLDKIHASGQPIHFPVQVNTDGIHARLDDGHHRVVVAAQMGQDKVPVSVLRVDKHFFSGKQPQFAPPLGAGLGQWLGGRRG